MRLVRIIISGQANKRQSRAGHAFAILEKILP